MAKAKRPSSKSTRLRRLLREQDNLCFYCQVEISIDLAQDHPRRATIYHKNPRARGGPNTMDNVVASCFQCNNTKGHLTAEEFKADIEPITMGRVMPPALQFLHDIKGVSVEETQPGIQYRVTLPNNVSYIIYPVTGSWTCVGSFVWTKGFQAAQKFQTEVERMMDMIAITNALREATGC